MKNGFNCFSLLAAKRISNPRTISQTKHPTGPSKMTDNNPENIRKSILNFTSHFWRNKPQHALSLQTRTVGARKGCFFLFPLCSEGVDEKKR